MHTFWQEPLPGVPRYGERISPTVSANRVRGVHTCLHLMMGQCVGVKRCLRVEACLAGCISGCKLLMREMVMLLRIWHGSLLLKAIVLRMLAICQVHCEAAMRCCHVSCWPSSGMARWQVALCSSLPLKCRAILCELPCCTLRRHSMESDASATNMPSEQMRRKDKPSH